MADLLIFYLNLFIAVTVFAWRLNVLAASKTVLQGDFFGYLLQVGKNITVQDVLAAAGTALGAGLLFPFALAALCFLSILVYGTLKTLIRRFCCEPLSWKSPSGPPGLELPETLEEIETFARSNDPEKRRLAVRSLACPPDLAWDVLADSDKKVRLNALCKLVAVGAITESKAREIFSSWEGCHRRYAEKNFGCLLEVYRLCKKAVL